MGTHVSAGPAHPPRFVEYPFKLLWVVVKLVARDSPDAEQLGLTSPQLILPMRFLGPAHSAIAPDIVTDLLLAV